MISDDGYVYWNRGTLWFSLAQFRDNVLLASNISPGTRTNLVKEVCNLLSQIWDLEVLCGCIDSGTTPVWVAALVTAGGPWV